MAEDAAVVAGAGTGAAAAGAAAGGVEGRRGGALVARCALGAAAAAQVGALGRRGHARLGGDLLALERLLRRLERLLNRGGLLGHVGKEGEGHLELVRDVLEARLLLEDLA